jgi:polyisoprenoid-binding protein YceI
MRTGTVTLIATGLAAALVAGPRSGAAQNVADASMASAPADTRWVVDMVHSQVDFRVQHLVGRVRGTFTKWYAVLTTKGGDWKLGSVDVSVETSSLSTGNSYRDDDLRSDRFFAVNRFPKMTFQGTGFAVSDSTVDVNGVLTIRGHAKPIVLSGVYRGIAKDLEGHERIAFEASTVVDRRDFGITYNQSVAGTDVIGNDVEITVAIEAVRVK